MQGAKTTSYAVEIADKNVHKHALYRPETVMEPWRRQGSLRLECLINNDQKGGNPAAESG
jgi:hypothetical protein